jgi:hypothetical protein
LVRFIRLVTAGGDLSNARKGFRAAFCRTERAFQRLLGTIFGFLDLDAGLPKKRPESKSGLGTNALVHE